MTSKQLTINKKEIPFLLLMAMISAIPFNGIRPLLPLGELAGELYIYFMLPLIGLYFLSFGSVSIPKGNYKYWLVLLVSWALIGSLFNYRAILTNTYKGNVGTSRFILQYAMLIFYISFIFVTYSILKPYRPIIVFQKIRTAMTASFVFCIIYSMLELPRLFGADYFAAVRHAIDSLYRDASYVDYGSLRLRSITFEAPSFGMYISFIYPWLLSYFLDRRFIAAISMMIFVWLFVFLSESRTGLVLLLAETFLFAIAVAIRMRGKYKVYAFTPIVAGIAVFAIDAITGMHVIHILIEKLVSVIETSEDSLHYVSNLGRWGAQLASFMIFLDYPLFGVGFGQQGFFMPDYYPLWSQVAFNVIEWRDPSSPTWPPAFSLYTRLLAETGLIGLIMFLGFAIHIIKKAANMLKPYRDGYGPFDIVLFVSIISSMVLLMQFGSLRVIYFWIYIAMILYCSRFNISRADNK